MKVRIINDCMFYGRTLTKDDVYVIEQPIRAFIDGLNCYIVNGIHIPLICCEVIPEPKFKVGDEVVYNSATMIDLLNRKLMKGDEGVIIDSSKKSDIWRVEFTHGHGCDKTSSVRFIEEKNLDLKTEPKFEFGMNLKVTHNISNSLVGLVGVVKGRKHQNGRYQYMMDFRKINSWRDLTWVMEDELEIYHEPKLNITVNPESNIIWNLYNGIKNKFKSVETFDKIDENIVDRIAEEFRKEIDKDVLDRFYSHSKIIDEHIIKENKMEEKTYVCPKHSDCVVARHCKRAIPHKHIKSDDFVCGKCPKCIEYKKGENKMEENKLDNLKKKFKELGTEIDKLEKAEKSKDDYVLKLNVSDDSSNSSLLVQFYKNGVYIGYIGEISNSGRCYILNYYTQISLYELWRTYGMKVCSDRVVWRGKEYYITDCGYLRCYNSASDIYDFKMCEYIGGCGDDNIVRFKHNNKPIGF